MARCHPKLERRLVIFVLGINAFHADSAACLFQNGRMIAAAEEERFIRKKHWSGFPEKAIRYCISEAGVDLHEIGHIAVNSNPFSNAPRKITRLAGRPKQFAYAFDRISHARRRWGLANALAGANLPGRFTGRVHRINHHLSHLASSFLVSPFERAVCVSIDGFGDFASAAWGLGDGDRLQVDGQIYYPHSLGVFYQAVTQYLGFPQYGDEYKVMGLAPYGEPRYLEAMRNITHTSKDGIFRLDLSYFTHDSEGFEYRWNGGQPVVGNLYSRRLVDLLGPARAQQEPLEQRHKDIACSLQNYYEELFLKLLNALYERYRVDTLSLAGGCAMNSVANGKVYEKTPFKRVYVQAAAGDAGGAIGAAAWVSTRVVRYPKRFLMDHAYWGPGWDDQVLGQITELHRAELNRLGCQIRSEPDQSTLLKTVARAVSEGNVVGWFQGRMEWGPRALGNRSIVCDPRRADMKEILNQKIKRRESFRPFAPSVLRSHVAEWFETDDDVPFMTQVFRIRQKKRKLIPAVTHVDGTGRLQTVSPQSNERYFGLIEAFYELTEVPMVLNTSFNENEPIVCTPEQAIECYLRTDMDWLVLGSQVISRS